MPLARVGARTESTTRYARRGQLPRTRIGIVRRTRARHAVCAEGLHFSAFHFYRDGVSNVSLVVGMMRSLKLMKEGKKREKKLQSPNMYQRTPLQR